MEDVFHHDTALTMWAPKRPGDSRRLGLLEEVQAQDKWLLLSSPWGGGLCL